MCNRLIFRRHAAGLLVFVGMQAHAAAADRPLLVPPPKEVRWSAGAPTKINPQSAAIVVGNAAAAPELYAAEMLRAHVAKRFGQTWPILRENDAAAKDGVSILLGQRSTHRRLDRLCEARGIVLNETSPGWDGYVIDTYAEEGRQVVLIAGANPRGVTYGQDTFFQLLQRNGDGIALTGASIRDWPSVRWRGRPQTAVSHYLRPGEFDLYTASRVNFIDLRGGIYAFEPGADLDRDMIGKVVREAHRAGLVVYGTVNCGVPRSEYDATLKTFDELIALGANGLWMSFDDKGPGEQPQELVSRIVDLGRQHGITESGLAITPPKGSYQVIVTDFNRKIMAVAGMEKALWFWTCLPSPGNSADAHSIGLKRAPAWWHNWPRFESAHSYVEIPPMSVGWHAPSYAVLAEGGKYCEAVMPWGGSGWGQYYIVPVIGWWGWDPERHDWPSTRSRIYATVFGPSQVTAAKAFDDALTKLRSFFEYPTKTSDWLPACPLRLTRPQGRDTARALVAEMGRALDDVQASASPETMLSAEVLESAYLGRMRAEFELHKAAVELSYPEDWWTAHQRGVLAAIHDGDMARADERIGAVRERLLGEVGRIGTSLKQAPHVDKYVKWWTGRAQLDAKGWRTLLADRRKELTQRVAEYAYNVVDPSKMLAKSVAPPFDWGTGRWQTGNRVLATVLPTEREMFWGDWLGGLYRKGKMEAAVFAATRRSPGVPGEFAELEVILPVTGRRDRLALLLFLSDFNKETISLTYVPARWAGYRYAQLIWNDRVLWEADIGLQRPEGEWFLVRLPPVPDNVPNLSLRLRVEDRKLSMNNYTIAFVGPIRLLELSE